MPQTGIVSVRVKPAASRTRVGGRHEGPHGPSLVVSVQAPAVDGRATEAARRALAEALQLPRSAVRLHSGAAARDKLFAVDDPPADLRDRVSRLMAGPP